MKRIPRAGAVVLLLVQLAPAQATQDHPSSAAPSQSASPTKPDTSCEPTAQYIGGKLVYTDCNGKKRDSNVTPKATAKSGQNPAAGVAGVNADIEAQAERADYEYHIFSKRHAERTFTFQYWTGKVIFWVVLAIVFAGIILSAVQFYVGLRHPLDRRAAADTKNGDEADGSVSEFEASLQGIKLKSSVMGLLILAMSMGFFYLYLKFVYPITKLAN
jgi:hypothetical protein